MMSSAKEAINNRVQFMHPKPKAGSSEHAANRPIEPPFTPREDPGYGQTRELEWKPRPDTPGGGPNRVLRVVKSLRQPASKSPKAVASTLAG